jgi:hypothetical protein
MVSEGCASHNVRVNKCHETSLASRSRDAVELKEPHAGKFTLKDVLRRSQVATTTADRCARRPSGCTLFRPSHRRHDRLGELHRLGCAADVARAHLAVAEDLEHRLLDAVSRLALAQMTEHEDA